jgi:kynurenine formamidase
MIVQFTVNEQHFAADLSRPIDLSLPLLAGFDTVNCFYAPLVVYEPVRMGSFVGSTAEGGVVNFFNVTLNPHGNGTHTECVGHIAKERYTIRECLRQFHFLARLISVYPQKMENGDRVITADHLKALLAPGPAEALILRTLPNGDHKRSLHYSGTNPPYLAADAVQYLVECGIRHLLIDLPSVDREEDEGRLAAHKAFWQYPGPAVRSECTITELIYVPDAVADGDYWLNLQTASFDLDVSPSKPVIYPLI